MPIRYTLEDIAFLTSAMYARFRDEYLVQTEKYSDPLRIQTHLRAAFPELLPSRIAVAMEQLELHSRGMEKCAFPHDSLYSRQGLEMASSLLTARVHAKLLPSGGRLMDCCAGIGSDAVRLAEAAETVCIEADEVTARICRHNLLQCNSHAMLLRGKLEHWLPLLKLSAFDAVYADPSRRDTIRRYISAEDYSPPLSLFAALHDLPLLIKIAPAAKIDDRQWGRAWVAAGRECKEQLLHRGLDLAALCVIHAESGTYWIPGTCEARRVSDPNWLIEPHPAVVCSGMTASYLREHGAEAIDPMIAYGLADERPVNAPLHQNFRLLRIEAFNRKRLRRSVLELDFGPGTEIKKRGFPETPEQVRRQLHFRGERNGVILLTRKGDGHVMIFAERVQDEHASS